MVTIPQILEFADAVKDYRGSRHYSWRHHEEARRVVNAWVALDAAAFIDVGPCVDAKELVQAIEALIARAPHMKDALREAHEAALVQYADGICDWLPAAAEDEEAAQ